MPVGRHDHCRQWGKTAGILVFLPHLILARHSELPTTPNFLSKRRICVLRGNSSNTIQPTHSRLEPTERPYKYLKIELTVTPLYYV